MGATRRMSRPRPWRRVQAEVGNASPLALSAPLAHIGADDQASAPFALRGGALRRKDDWRSLERSKRAGCVPKRGLKRPNQNERTFRMAEIGGQQEQHDFARQAELFARPQASAMSGAAQGRSRFSCGASATARKGIADSCRRKSPERRRAGGDRRTSVLRRGARKGPALARLTRRRAVSELDELWRKGQTPTCRFSRAFRSLQENLARPTGFEPVYPP